MPIAYPLPNRLTQVFLSKEEFTSLIYHNIFEYPLTMAELVKWSAGPEASIIGHQSSGISQTNGYYHLTANPGAVLKRLMRGRISSRKVEIAKKAARVISFIPTAKMVAVTGALAMENAADESDVDLMIVVKKGTLWTTRAFAYMLICLFRIPFRRSGDANQRDKLCLNMWLDESDLSWPTRGRNIYTAHEIAQIVPLVNRDQTYEKFIEKNNWIREYWPNSVKIRNPKFESRNKLEFSKFKFLDIVSDFVLRASNLVAFKMQYAYMRKKITREIITSTRALFHPVDWSEFVLSKLQG